MAPPPPHPWAGKSGEGPPIAPPNWKWRAGKRISDMYFYSPSGKQFRSRPELANYLQTLNNPPDASLFCWRVTPEVLKNGYIPEGDVLPTKPALKRKAQSPLGGGAKRIKTAPPKLLLQPSASAVQPTEGQPAALIFPDSTLPQRVTTLSCPLSLEHGQANGRDTNKGKRVRISVPHSFKSILAGRSSFKWLYDSETLEKFLEEARRLKYKSPAEINEIRKVILERHLDMSNICKYPNSVIRVFVRLLRNEEPPTSMGKVELADLCVTWRCKKRHYWCFLELGRVSALRTKLSKAEDDIRGDGFRQNRGCVGHGVATDLKGKSGDHHHDPDDIGKGNQNGWLDPAGSQKLDCRFPDGSVRVTEKLSRSAEPSVEFQAQGTCRPGDKSEFSKASQSMNLDIANARRPDGVAGTSLEEVETWPVVPASNLNGIDGVTRTADSGGENERLSQGSGRTVQRERRHDGTTIVSWDNASLSGASNGLLQGEAVSDEGPAFSVTNRGKIMVSDDGGRRPEAVELTQQNNPKTISASETASDLYGENIIVITGFKSKCTGSVYGSDKGAQVNGGSCAIEGRPFASISGSATMSSDGSKFLEMHNRTGISAAETVHGVLPRKNVPEPTSSSKGGGLSAAFPGSIKMGAIRGTSLRGEDKRSKGLSSNFKNSIITHKPEGISKVGQGSFQIRERLRLDDSALKPNGGGISQQDVSETLFFSKGGLSMVRDLQTPAPPPAYGNDAAFRSKNHSLVLSTVKQEPLVPYDDDGSPTLDKKQQTASVPEHLMEEQGEGTWGEHLKIGSEENTPLTSKHFSAFKESFVCWCRICGSDFSFCRGCMCSFCKKTLQQGEDWTVVKCICDHVCHIDCALAANAAGVVKELGLDGELSCPSCSRKVDLWPFFQKRFDLILSLSEVDHVNLKGLEKLLLQAVQLLKGSEESRYSWLEGLVVETYELTRKFPVLVLIQQLLRTVRDELHTPRPDLEFMEGELSGSATPEQIDLLKKEHLAREALDNAKRERLLMEEVVDKVHRAYEDALNKRKQARGAPRSSCEPELLKAKVNAPVTKELISLQQAKVDQELQKLWDMRKFEAGDSMTFSALDASAGTWLESLKAQRVVVEAAKAELKHLEILNNHST